MIPYGRQEITQADIDSVVDVLRSKLITQGPIVPQFEQAVAKAVGAKYAVATNSATSALHIACLALGLERGDWLWTSPNSFVASANCARYCGANVDFVDIDPETWNMSVAGLEEKLRDASAQGRLPKIIIPVHFAGQPTDQEKIWALAQEYGCRVLEDASHALGAARNGEAVGSGRWSEITVFSFHPVKIITSGEGGMAVTNDDQLAAKMTMLRSHGITRASEQLVNYGASPDPGGWYYEQQVLGYNFRLTDIHAALGLSQLQRLSMYIERRNNLATHYDEMLKDLPLRLPVVRAGNLSAFHLYVVRLMEGAKSRTQREVYDALRQQGIGANVHYMPIHLQPYYRSLGFKEGQCPEAEAHGRSAITLPLYPTMTAEEQQVVIHSLRNSL